jgi:hypothetical protein
MQRRARCQRGVGINGAVASFDEANHALFVDDDVSPQRPLVGFILHVVTLQDAVRSQHLVVHVAEKREINIDLFGEGGIGCGTIHANAEYCGIRGVDLTRGDASLDRLKLFRSTAGESQDVHGQENILLSAEVTELYSFPFVAEQREVWRSVSYFQRHLCHFWFLSLLRQRRSHRRSGQQDQ